MLSDYMLTLIRSVMAFFTLFILARILGKKQISQLNFFEYVMGITVGSIAASMSTDLRTRAFPQFIALAVWIGLGLMLEIASLKLDSSIAAKHWQQAEQEANLLDKAWNKLGPKIQISSEEDDLKKFAEGIKRLQGYIKAQDLPSSLGEIQLLKFVWQHLGNGF